MSRQYMNGRWCVRCGRKGATPFLKTSLPKILAHHLLTKPDLTDVCVVDIGCGNGRNMDACRSAGLTDVHGYDMCTKPVACPVAKTIEAHDAYVANNIKPFVLGHDKLPHADRSVDVILANYVFMFLSDEEQEQVLDEINRVARKGAVLVMELYPAKDSCIHDDKQMVALQNRLANKIEQGLNPEYYWDRIRWCKGKCLLRLTWLPGFEK